MNLSLGSNDFSEVIENDRTHVWHHLSQHKRYETADPLVIIEGKGMRVWDAKGKEYLDAVVNKWKAVDRDLESTRNLARQWIVCDMDKTI